MNNKTFNLQRRLHKYMSELYHVSDLYFWGQRHKYGLNESFRIGNPASTGLDIQGSNKWFQENL
jgi:hypothetical protein